jgi:RNA-binding protein 25
MIYNATGVNPSTVANTNLNPVASSAAATAASTSATPGWDQMLKTRMSASTSSAPVRGTPYNPLVASINSPPPPPPVVVGSARSGGGLGLPPGMVISVTPNAVGASVSAVPAAAAAAAGAAPPLARAYVGRIPLDVDNEFLKRLLSVCGPVREWNRIRDPNTGRDKAFGYAEFVSPDSLSRALRVLNGFTLFDSDLLLKCDSQTQIVVDAAESVRRRTFIDTARERDASLDEAAAELKWKASRTEEDDRVELLAHRLFDMLFERRSTAAAAVVDNAGELFVLDEAEVDSMPIDEVRTKLNELRARHNPKDTSARLHADAAAAHAADARRAATHSGGGGTNAGDRDDVPLNRGVPPEAELHVERERIDRKRMRDIRARDERRRVDHVRMLADDSARERMERDADRRDAERYERRRRAAAERARLGDDLKELRRLCEDERDRRQLRYSQRRRSERRAERDDDEAAFRREDRDRRAREAKEAAEAKARAEAEAQAQAQRERFMLKKTDGALSSIPLQLRNAATKRKVNNAVFSTEGTEEEAIYQRKKNLKLTRLDDNDNDENEPAAAAAAAAAAEATATATPQPVQQAAPSREALFAKAVRWDVFDERQVLGSVLKAHIEAATREFLSADDPEFVDFVSDQLRAHCTASALVSAIEPVLDSDAEKFVQRVWHALLSATSE